jgi:hypothetical protein
MSPGETHFYVSGGTLRPDAPSYVERACSLAPSARKPRPPALRCPPRCAPPPALDADLFQALQHGECCKGAPIARGRTSPV